MEKTPTVLLVDDEYHARLMMNHILEKLDWEVVAEAEDGRQALEMYRLHRPDVVLMDVIMPVMDGIQTLKAIITEFPDAVVVILTSLDDPDVVQECMDAGAANFLRKDLLLMDLRQGLKDTWKVFSEILENNEELQ